MKRIISIIISIFLILNTFCTTLIASAADETCDHGTCYNCNTSIANDYNIDTDVSETDSVDTNDGVQLYPIFEKRNYSTNEEITVRFEFVASYTGIDTIYEANGFIVANDITSSSNADLCCEIYDVVLTYDGVTQNPYFSFGVVTNTGLTFYAEVFGYLSANGLFISESSFDSAKEASYYYLVEQGLLTIEQFNEILQQEYSQIGVENSNLTIQDDTVPTSSTQGTLATLLTTNSSALTIVSGNLRWKDDNNVWHPMQYNRVEIWCALSEEKLETVYTNVSGDYSLAVSHSFPLSIYIKIYPGGENSIVKTGYGGDYVYTSSTQTNIAPGSNVNIGWDVDMTSDLGRAFQISQAINVATKYVKEMDGAYITPVTVKYPHVENVNNENDKGCFYSSSEDTIYICGSPAQSGCPESYASWDVLMHEYGHHVQHEFGITNNPGGEHYFETNLADLYESKDIGIRLAWGEAYASVFSGMAQAYYASSLQNIATVGDTAYTSYNTAYINYEETTTRKGEACEASIIGVLWDLYDSVSETHDSVSFSHTSYWEMITNCDSGNFSEFCNYYISTYSTSDDMDFGKLLSYYKMGPSNLNTYIGTTTITLSWNANGTTSELKNDRFDLLFLDENKKERLRIENITSTEYTLSDTERNIVLNGDGSIYYIIVVAYQTSSPTTGGYYSAYRSVTKPSGYPHTHTYGLLYMYYNNREHRKTCSCTSYIAEAHYVRQSEIVNGRYARCLGCRTLLDLYEDYANSILSNIIQVSVNGSYILSNGIVILVDEDVQAYEDGTLQFYHPDSIPETQ